MNAKQTLIAGAVFGGLGVAFGAFGAHALKPFLLDSGRLETYELAVRYEFYHALALLAAGLLQQSLNNKLMRLSSLFFLAGILLFSGSLYLLCFTQIKFFGAITPIGGVLLILGWTLFAAGVSRKSN